MASSKYYLFVNFLLFFIFLQENFINSDANVQCLNPTFDKNKKIVVDYFFTLEEEGIAEELCQIINNSNGLISPAFRLSSPVKNKATCIEDNFCIEDRIDACYLKLYPDISNDCNALFPTIDTGMADCICAGSADYILAANKAVLDQYGIRKTPFLLVDNKYDPCFTDYSLKSMTEYFCKAYKNVLKMCD